MNSTLEITFFASTAKVHTNHSRVAKVSCITVVKCILTQASQELMKMK